MSNSVDPDEMVHYEPSDLDLCCLQKAIIIACSSERVKTHIYNSIQYTIEKFRFKFENAPYFNGDRYTFKRGNSLKTVLPSVRKWI